MTEPDRKTFDGTAARLALQGYVLSETPRGYLIEGHGKRIHTPLWVKVALFVRLNRAAGTGDLQPRGDGHARASA